MPMVQPLPMIDPISMWSLNPIGTVTIGYLAIAFDACP